MLPTQIGFASLEEELLGLQSLRADPPGLAGEHEDRRRVFCAGLHQFGELLGASTHAGVASAPILLFYALSQAGRAIAAARCDDERWRFQGHGLRVRENPHALTNTRVSPRARTDRSDAFSVVSDTLGSQALGEEVGLGRLWASIPENELVRAGQTEEHAAILLQAEGTIAIHATLEVADAHAPREQWREKLEKRLRAYPAVGAFEIQRSFTQTGGPPGITVAFPAAGGDAYRLLSDVGEPLWGDDSLYLRPAVNDAGDLPSVFMSWWVLLLSFSHYARYVPAAWTDVLARDSSRLAVPIERTLEAARRQMPRQVLRAVTGAWE